MRKITALVLATCLSIPWIGSAAFADESSNTVVLNTYFEEDFNSVETGGTTSSFEEYVLGSNKIYVAENPDAADKSLCFDSVGASSKSSCRAVLNTGRAEGSIAVDFKVCLTGESNEFRIYVVSYTVGEKYLAKIIGTNLMTPSGSIVAPLTPGVFYPVTIIIHTETSTADYYVNNRKKVSGVQFFDKNLEAFDLLRFYQFNNDTAQTRTYIDDVRVYESERPASEYLTMGKTVKYEINPSSSPLASDRMTADYMNGAAALYVNKNKIYSGGEAKVIDEENPSAAPFIEDGRTLAPVRAIAEALSATVTWDDETKTAAIAYDGGTVTVTAYKKSFTVNGEEKSLDVPATIKDGRIYLPVRAIAEAMGKKLTYDKSGMVIIADRENFFDFKNDIPIFRNVARNLVFTDYDGQAIVKAAASKGHPRLHANAEKLAGLKSYALSDPQTKRWSEYIIKAADAYIEDFTLLTYMKDGIVLDKTVNKLNREVEAFCYAYAVTGEKKYAEYCIKELVAAAGLPDWNPYRFLDPASMMRSMALGYDWMYNEMTESERKTVRDGIVKNGLNEILTDLNGTQSARSYVWAQSSKPDNWNIVCNSGGIQSALAIAEDEPELCAEIFEKGLKLLEKAAVMYAPDGSWYEGPGYWGYAGQYFSTLMSALNSSCDMTFGFMDIPGMSETGYFPIVQAGPGGSFNVGDAEANTGENKRDVILFFSRYFNDADLQKIVLNNMNTMGFGGTIYAALWYNPDLKTDRDLELERDYHLRDLEIFVMRDDWNNGDNAIFTGMHAGRSNVPHGHMDAGHFIVDGYGSRFICSTGYESDSPSRKSKLYRYRAEGCNVLLIDPDETPGQRLAGVSVIDRYDSNNSSAYAVTDLTDMYKTAESVVRGIKLYNNRKMITVQDEIKLKKPGDIWWQAHTRREIRIAEDGKSARLVGTSGMDLIVSLASDVPATFSEAEAKSMVPELQTDDDVAKNKIYKKLVLHLDKKVKEAVISVNMQFVPSVEGIDANLVIPDVTPIADWKLDDESENTPTVTSIKANGKEFEGFRTSNLLYTYTAEKGEDIPVITAEGRGNVSVEYCNTVPLYVKVTAENDDKTLKSVYFVRVVEAAVDEAMGEKLEIKAHDASDEPEAVNNAKNSYDGDLSTRWSAQGIPYITYDIGEVRKITNVGLAVYQENNEGRKQYFEILLSEDGRNYKKVYAGETSGTTLEEEIFKFTPTNARYIRIQCNGTSVGNWNSITECSIYGE